MSIALGGLLLGEVINGGLGGSDGENSGGLGGVLSGLLEKLPIGNYVGELNAIIQNGWDLKCFNSTYKSNEVTEWIQNNISPAVLEAIQKMDIATTETGVQKALNDAAEVVQQSYWLFKLKLDGNNWESCSKKALTLGVDAGKTHQNAFNKAIEVLKTSYDITVVQTIQKQADFTFNGLHIDLKGRVDYVPVPVMTVKRKSVNDNPSQNITGVGTANQISTSVITTGLSVASAIAHYFINKNSY